MNPEQEKEVEKFANLRDQLLADKRFTNRQLIEILESAIDKLEMRLENLEEMEEEDR